MFNTNVFYQTIYATEIRMILMFRPDNVWEYCVGYDLTMGVSGGIDLFDRDFTKYHGPHFKIITSRSFVPRQLQMTRNGHNVTNNVSQKFIQNQIKILQKHIDRKYYK